MENNIIARAFRADKKERFCLFIARLWWRLNKGSNFSIQLPLITTPTLESEKVLPLPREGFPTPFRIMTEVLSSIRASRISARA